MQQEHRQLLRSNRMTLTRDLEAKTVASHLYSKEIISETDNEEIQVQKTNQERSEMLLDKLPKKGPNAFETLCNILKEVQPHLEKILRPIQSRGEQLAYSARNSNATRTFLNFIVYSSETC